MAFSISNLEGAEPSIKFLNDFENKIFRNQSEPKDKPKKQERPQIKVYNQESDDEENEILGAYVCITPKVSS